MKISHLLITAAVVAASSTTASAANNGNGNGNSQGIGIGITTDVGIGNNASVGAAGTAAANATYVNPGNPANVGTANSSETADFTITGAVSQACVLGAGGDLNDINFGTIGIYADATSTVENVFTSVGTADGHTRTNLAGCNTSNTMTITKTNGVDGLVNSAAATGGYDGNVFQKNIPYTVSALYTAGATGTLTPQASISQFSVADGASTNSKTNAAWKSNASFKIVLSDPTKALVAGTYTDTVTVTLAAL